MTSLVIWKPTVYTAVVDHFIDAIERTDDAFNYFSANKCVLAHNRSFFFLVREMMHIVSLTLCNVNHPYNKLTECIMFRCAVAFQSESWMLNCSLALFHMN